MSVVGLDFGNDTCKIAVAKNKGIEVLQNDVGSRKTPNMVAYGEKQRFIGEDAVAQYSSNPKNSINGVKRFLGRPFADPELKLEQAYGAFQMINNKDRVAFEVQYEGKAEQLMPEQVAASMFSRLKRIAEKGLTGQRVQDCVVGCPVWWTDAQRRAMLDAANIAGLNVLRLINEPTAVALYYAMSRTEHKEERRVMFIDVGHACTQASIVHFQAEQLTVLAANADRNLGGRDFDEMLIEHFGQYVHSKYKLDVLNNAKARLKLAKECQKVKHMLSANTKVPFKVEYIMNDTDVSGTIERHEFEALAAKSLLPRLIKLVTSVLEKASLTKDQLTTIEIVGGGVRVPAILHSLEEYFGRHMSRTCDGDESVARGAAWMCAMLSPTVKLKTVFEVKDINIYPITVHWGPIDPEGSSGSLPASASAASPSGTAAMDVDSEQLFSSAQPFPHLKIISFTDRKEPFQLSAYYSDPSLLPPATNPLLGKFIVNGMGTLEKPLKIKVKVKLNIHSCLQVTGAEMVEVLPPAEAAPASSPTAAAAAPATSPTAGDAKPASETEEAPMDEKEDSAAGATPAGDAKAAPAAGATPAAGAAATPAPAPAKQRVRRTELKVVSNLAAGFDQKMLQSTYERESRMEENDHVVLETSLAKNALEAYALEMQNKLRDELKEYIKEADAAAYVEKLMAAEDWLNEDGFDAQRSEYKSRRDELAKVGDAAIARKNESLNRDSYVSALKSTINRLTTLANTTEAKYEHITSAERAPVLAALEAADQWLFQSQRAQDKLSKADPPAVTCDQLRAKQQELEKLATPVFAKQKPAPPPAPAPAAEPKKEADPTSPKDAPKAEAAKAEAKKEEPKK